MSKRISGLLVGNGKVQLFGRMGAAVLPAAVILFCAGSASASSITIPSTAEITQSDGYNVGGSGNLGSDGYRLYDWNSTDGPISLPASYVASVATQPNSFASPNESTFTGANPYSKLEVNGVSSNTSEYTGQLFYSAQQSADMVKITLKSGVGVVIPAMIQIALLDDNAFSATNDTKYTITDTNSVDSVTTNNIGGSSLNHFYIVDIQNASPGDVIDIFGTRVSTSSGNTSLGAVLFDSVPAPEPATLGLFALGSLGILARRRRKA